jgi:hypothetical protein
MWHVWVLPGPSDGVLYHMIVHGMMSSWPLWHAIEHD